METANGSLGSLLRYFIFWLQITFYLFLLLTLFLRGYMELAAFNIICRSVVEGLFTFCFAKVKAAIQECKNTSRQVEVMHFNAHSTVSKMYLFCWKITPLTVVLQYIIIFLMLYQSICNILML